MTLMDIAPYLLVAIIVFINIGLWTSLRNKETHQFFELWRKAGTTMQRPWEKEDRNLQELAARVKYLRKKPQELTSEESNLRQDINTDKEKMYK